MNKHIKGFVLAETLVYVFVMVIVIGATTYFLITTYNLYRATLFSANADRVGAQLLNELIRETRSGVSIDLGNSSFGVTAGEVTFNTLGGTTHSFALVDERIMLIEGANDPIPLSPNSVTITRFLLTFIDTPVSEAVRYDIGVSYELRGSLETKYYQGVAILRQSYE